VPKLVIFLLVWFLWATGRDLDSLVRFSISTDYYVFLAADIPWLFFVMGFAVFALNTATVYCLFRPQPAGLWVLLNALIAGFVQNLVAFAFGIQNLANVREVYASNRELRGLPVREEALERFFTPHGLTMTLGVMFAVYALLALIAFQKKHYFCGTKQSSV